VLTHSDARVAPIQTETSEMDSQAESNRHDRKRYGRHPVDNKQKTSLDLLSPTIFHEPWWLEIASAGKYEETIVESGGRMVGRLPFFTKRRAFGLKSLEMPALTYLLGPAILPEFATCGAVRSLKAFHIVKKLVNALPPAWHASFRLHADTGNALAFAAAGFQVSVDQSVEILADEQEVLWRQMRDKNRNMIRRAREHLTIRPSTEPGFFSRFYQECLNEAGKQNTYDEAVVEPLVVNASSRQVGRVLVADRPDGTPEAAIFTVWDAKREYYLMSARRRTAHSGAINLLIWEALCSAAESGRIFDMAGIHVLAPNVPNLVLLTGFGGTIVTRLRVARTHPILKEAFAISSLFRHKSGL
jgi:hypothetical protein